MSEIDHETQQTIGEWADMTFGTSTIARRFERMFDEVREIEWFLQFTPKGPLTPQDKDELTSELADVYITLCGLAHTAEIDLQSVVDEKMKINRGRKWTLHGDGTGQHVDEGDPAA